MKELQNEKIQNRIHIAVIIVGWNMDYRLEMLAGMYEAADQYHCVLHVYTCMGELDQNHAFYKGEYSIFDLPDYKLYDGIVFISNTVFAESVVQQLSYKFSELDVPVVCTDRRMKNFGFMGTDNYVAMKSMMEHMVKFHNYKRFKMIAGPKNNRESNLRIKAFTDVLREHGIEVSSDDIYNANYGMNGALGAIQYYLGTEEKLPDAFICANDLMALTVCWELKKLGYSVPGDVAVTGFDNISQTRICDPSITSIGRAKMVMGREAVKNLVDRISGRTDKIDFYVPYQLCIRESCGCNKKEDISFSEISSKLFNYDIEKTLMNNLANTMEDDLISCRTYNDFIMSIRNHVPARFIHKFFVCLNDSVANMLSDESETIERLINWDDTSTTQYDSCFSIPVAYDNGHYNSYKKMSFMDVLTLVDSEENISSDDHEDVAYFMPLHFRERCFGFLAFAGNRANITNDFIGNYVKKIANSLEQLRVHRIEKLTIDKLKELYETDSMTGLFNRFGYKKCIDEMVERYKHSKDSIMVQFFDMDELKIINDAYGHDTGNQAIMLVAKCMSQVFKDENLVRYGGDEFIALGINLTHEVMKIKNKEFMKLLESESKKNDFKHPISVSVGYCIVEHPQEADPQMWINLADQAMYAEKLKKKKKVRV